ncbi:hypothetical protein QCA50_006039 [Cerrena zonata]|uniref:Uncharacterized protein n=1 Tax=Cerrena zonata TaxID=2478898 RepID=A0AAW0GC39_9APHY
MTIRGAYKKSARPPPSLREMFDQISETPPLTSHESSLDGLADSTSLWDFDGLDSSPQSDDSAPGNARPSNDDNLASTLGQTNTNTLPPSVGDITNDLGSGHRRLTTNTTPPSSPEPSLTVPLVIHPLIVPPSETNRNGIRGRIWVGTRRFTRKIVENLRMLYQEAEVSACVSVGPW